MADPQDRRDRTDLTADELEAQRAEQLPAREVMSTVWLDEPIDPPIPVEDVDVMYPIDPPPKAV